MSSTPPLSNEEFTALAERHSRELFAFLRSVVRDPELARDLTQDTFCAAWEAATHLAPPFVAGGATPSMRGWLYRVGYRRAIDALRRRRVIHWEPLAEELDSEAEAALTSQSFEALIVERDAMRQAMEALDPRDVACLLLLVVQRFTAAEAAQILGASPQAVAKRYSRAKQRLLVSYLSHNLPRGETR